MFIKLSLFLQMGAIIMTTGADDLCPEQCSCRPNAITCEGMTSFPAYIPKMAETVYLFKMNITDIPPGSFENLTNIKHIEIYQSKIQRIRSCAFSNLKNMDTLSIHEAEIGEIESYAFSSLTNLESLSLFNTTVDFIHPLAFVAIHNVSNWDFNFLEVNIMDSYAITRISQVSFMNIFTSKFREFRSNAIFNISLIGSFQFQKNSLGTLQCRTIEDISKAVPSFAFLYNKLECTCALSWLLPHSKSVGSSLFWSLQYNTCQGPEAFILDTGNGKAIADLKDGDLICVNETELNSCPDLAPPSPAVSSCSWMAPQLPTDMTPEAVTGRTSELSTETTSEASTEMSRKPSSKKHESWTTETTPEASTEMSQKPSSKKHGSSTTETTSEASTEMSRKPSSKKHESSTTETTSDSSTEMSQKRSSKKHESSTTETTSEASTEMSRKPSSKKHESSTTETTSEASTEMSRKPSSKKHDSSTTGTSGQPISSTGLRKTSRVETTSDPLTAIPVSSYLTPIDFTPGSPAHSTSVVPVSDDVFHPVRSTITDAHNGQEITHSTTNDSESSTTTHLKATNMEKTTTEQRDTTKLHTIHPNNQTDDRSLGEIVSSQKVPCEVERGDNSSSNVTQSVNMFWLVVFGSFISVLVSK